MEEEITETPAALPPRGRFHGSHTMNFNFFRNHRTDNASGTLTDSPWMERADRNQESPLSEQINLTSGQLQRRRVKRRRRRINYTLI